MAKVIIECTDDQAKSIADSFVNEKRKIILNRMLATDKVELINNVIVIKDDIVYGRIEDDEDYGLTVDYYINIESK